MIVGVPTEIKPDERRVALTPAGAAAFRHHDHTVLVQRGAGLGSGFADNEYRAAGARVTDSAAAVWRRAALILKVKEPQPSEFRYLRPGLILFTYLHLAAERGLTRELLKRRVDALGYETVQLEDGSLPLLAPMSEVAGRLAIQVGGWCLEAQNGGRGVLLSGAPGVRPGKVLIIGGGIAGFNASHVAAGVGAEVTILDVSPVRLRYLNELLNGQAVTLMSNRATLEEELREADLVVGTVLVPGARTPRLITARLVATMKRGAAYIDLRADQRDGAVRAGYRRPRSARSRRTQPRTPLRPQHLGRQGIPPRRRRIRQAETALPVGLRLFLFPTLLFNCLSLWERPPCVAPAGEGAATLTPPRRSLPPSILPLHHRRDRDLGLQIRQRPLHALRRDIVRSHPAAAILEEPRQIEKILR